MIIHPAEQGSQEWLDARSTVVTASQFKAVMSKGRGSEPSLTRKKYMITLANSIVTGRPAEQGYTNAAMAEGTRREPESRDFYSMLTGHDVTQHGLIYLDEDRRIGASVDGMIEDRGLVEFKNPNLETHIGYVLDGGLPAEYLLQVQGQMWVTGTQWCDFFSYHPDAFKMHHLVKVWRDDAKIAEIKAETDRFISELDAMVETFRKMAED